MIDRKPKGYWQDFNNIQKELAPLIDKYGSKEMTKEGLSSLTRYIHRFRHISNLEK